MITKARVLFAVALLLPGSAIAVLSLRGEPQPALAAVAPHTKANEVLPAELAEWIITGRNDFVLLDMRDLAAYRQGHIRGAFSCQSCHGSREEGKQFLQSAPGVDLAKRVVLYTETGAEEVRVPKIIHDNPYLYHLRGGYRAWSAEVLAEAKLADGDSEAVALSKQKHNAVRNLFLGKAVAAEAPVRLKIKPVRRMRAHKSADEGC